MPNKITQASLYSQLLLCGLRLLSKPRLSQQVYMVCGLLKAEFLWAIFGLFIRIQ